MSGDMNKSFAKHLERHQKISGELRVVETDLLAALRAWCESESQKAVASALGVSPAYLNDVVHGRRTFGRNILEMEAE